MRGDWFAYLLRTGQLADIQMPWCCSVDHQAIDVRSPENFFKPALFENFLKPQQGNYYCSLWLHL